MKFSSIVERIKPSASMKIGLGARGKEYINFAIGAPDIEPPDAIRNIVNARAELSSHPYTSAAGSLEARKNMASLISASTELNPDNVMLCEGAKYGIYLALKALCEKGEKVLLIEPYWLSYPQMAASLELEPVVFSPLIPEAGLLSYDLNRLVDAAIQNKVKVVIVNNPNNPSGQIFKLAEVDQLAKRLHEAGVWLLIDEVYKDLVYDRGSEDNFAIEGLNVIRVGSFSKTLCVPGLRLGYIVAQPFVLEKLLLISQHIQTCVNTYALAIAEKIDRKTMHEHAVQCSTVYQARYMVLKNCLENTGLKLLACESSFYAFVDFSAYFSHALEACKFLEEKHKILTTPGHEYGESFKRYVRICLTLPQDIIEAKFKQIVHEGF